jgi:hypothetical protein
MIWLALALVVLAIFVGAFALGWRASAWYCQQATPSCPRWRPQWLAMWIAGLKKHYPNGSHERHPTPVPTPGAVPMARLDNEWRAGIPSQRMDTPTTGVANPKRKT